MTYQLEDLEGHALQLCQQDYFKICYYVLKLTHDIGTKVVDPEKCFQRLKI